MLRNLSFNKKYFSTLIISDPNIGFSTLPNLISGAKQIDKEIDVLITGNNINEQFNTIKTIKTIHSIRNLFTCENDIFKYNNYEALSKVGLNLINKENYDNIIMGNSSIGKETLSYLSGKYKTQPITEIIKINNSNEFIRPIYAGNAISKVISKSNKKFLGLRATSFEKSEEEFNFENLENKKIENIDFNNLKFNILKEEIIKSDKPSLTEAKYVISGGRALKSKENFIILEKLADKIGSCAIGASRAAVDAGYVNNDLQVGQTGKVVAPDLYIAFGISGAIQHLAGIKDSKYIVAINTDPEAPIFQVADYGIVGDLFKIIPELTEKL